jgi:hypothetical protein
LLFKSWKNFYFFFQRYTEQNSHHTWDLYVEWEIQKKYTLKADSKNSQLHHQHSTLTLTAINSRSLSHCFLNASHMYQKYKLMMMMMMIHPYTQNIIRVKLEKTFLLFFNHQNSLYSTSATSILLVVVC